MLHQTAAVLTLLMASVLGAACNPPPDEGVDDATGAVSMGGESPADEAARDKYLKLVETAFSKAIDPNLPNAAKAFTPMTKTDEATDAWADFKTAKAQCRGEVNKVMVYTVTAERWNVKISGGPKDPDVKERTLYVLEVRDDLSDSLRTYGDSGSRFLAIYNENGSLIDARSRWFKDGLTRSSATEFQTELKGCTPRCPSLRKQEGLCNL